MKTKQQMRNKMKAAARLQIKWMKLIINKTMCEKLHDLQYFETGISEQPCLTHMIIEDTSKCI
jgi:hypothetical protein